MPDPEPATPITLELARVGFETLRLLRTQYTPATHEWDVLNEAQHVLEVQVGLQLGSAALARFQTARS